MYTSKHKIVFILLASLLVGLLPFQQASAQTGKETIESLVGIFSNSGSSPTSFSQNQLSEAAKYIDYPTMAEESLGQYWNKLSDKQKAVYLQSFKSLIEQRYYKRWHRVFSKSKISYADEKKLPSGNVIVKTKILTGEESKTVLWTLTGNDPKVVNLTVDQEDLVKKANARFARKIAGVGIPAFIKWISYRANHSATEET